MNMNRFFSFLVPGALLIASAVSFSACQQPENSVSEQPAAGSPLAEVTKEAETEAASEDNSAALAQKEAETEAEAIYQNSCQSCHSMAPPAKSAPAIIALAGQYRARYSKKAGAVADMVSFMKEPSIGKSILGSSTFERFGLMPAMSLPDEELEKVAGWLWDQYDPNFEGDADCQ